MKNRNQNFKGKLIVFDGVHAAGKTTQINRLKSRLEKNNYQVFVSRAHQGDSVNNSIRKLINNPSSSNFNDQLVRLFLVSAARTSRIKNEIIPALKKGNIVLCDRLTPSTLVFQAWMGKIDDKLVSLINKVSCQGVKTNINFIFDLSPKLIKKRVNKSAWPFFKKDKIDHLPEKFHKKSRDGFRFYAKKYNWKIIDGNQPEEVIENIIWENVKKIL